MDYGDTKEEIRRRVRIEDVVSEHVPLLRAGRRLKACCPFHQEKTPSFYVNPELGLYKCFGCGVGGDVFDFVMRIERIEFPEAAERLAERAGLQWRATPQDDARAKRRQLARRANDIAVNYYSATLWSPAGQPGLDYLRRRGFTDETIRRFGLGYAPDQWDGLLRHLRSQGIDGPLAEEAGLAKGRESGGHYDVFRHRVMFPIIDAGNRVLGFGGRALAADDPAKYLNTPDTPTFKKGRHVYAINLAASAVTAARQVVVVEGYTDVISLHQAGIENVVACLGTSLTAEHLELLARYADEIVLAYDADKAGLSAATRNVPMLEACKAEVTVVLLPEGMDPDECVKAQGAEGFRALLAKRKSPVEFEIDALFAAERGQGPEGVTRAAQKAVDVLLRVPDRARRDEFLARAADHWGEGQPGRVEAMQRAMRLEISRRIAERHTRTGPAPQPVESPRDRRFIVDGVSRDAAGVVRWLARAETDVLTAALAEEAQARQIANRLPADGFSSASYREIAEAIEDQLAEGTPYSAAEVLSRLEAKQDTYQIAVQLAMADPEQIGQEVIAASLAKLCEYHRGGRYRGTYEVEPDEEQAPPPAVDDFQELRRRVIAKINAGEATDDDPDIVLYKQVMSRAHGAGGSMP